MSNYRYSGDGGYWKAIADIVYTFTRHATRPLAVLHVGVADGSVARYLGGERYRHYGLDPAPMPSHVVRPSGPMHFDVIIHDAFIGTKKVHVDLSGWLLPCCPPQLVIDHLRPANETAAIKVTVNCG